MEYCNEFGEKINSKPFPTLPERVFGPNDGKGWIVLTEDQYLIAAFFPEFLKPAAHVSVDTFIILGTSNGNCRSLSMRLPWRLAKIRA